MSTVKETAAAWAGAAGSKPGPVPDAKDDLKSLPVPEVEKRLASSPDLLTGAEAAGRLTRYGPNEIAEKKEWAPWHVLPADHKWLTRACAAAVIAAALIEIGPHYPVTDDAARAELGKAKAEALPGAPADPAAETPHTEREN